MGAKLMGNILSVVIYKKKEMFFLFDFLQKETRLPNK